MSNLINDNFDPNDLKKELIVIQLNDQKSAFWQESTKLRESLH